MENAYFRLLMRGGMNADPSLYLSIYDGIKDPEAVQILVGELQRRDVMILGLDRKVHFSPSTEFERPAFVDSWGKEGMAVKRSRIPYNPRIKQNNWR